jgi:hypothetical protein
MAIEWQTFRNLTSFPPAFAADLYLLWAIRYGIYKDQAKPHKQEADTRMVRGMCSLRQRNKWIAVAALLWCAAAGAGSLFGIPFTMIPAGSPVLDDIRFLVRESGSSFRSFTPPLSRDEALQILDGIDAESLSEGAREAYDRAYAALSPALLYAEGYFGLEAHAILAPEVHFRTNPAIPFAKRDSESPMALSLPLAMYFADTVELTITPSFSSDPMFYGEAGSHWGTNVPYEAKRFDMNMPLRAFIAAGGAWWNAQLGRERVSYGLGHTGNLALNATPDFYDFARLSLFSPNFKYSAFISQMPMNTKGILSGDRKAAAEAAGETLFSTTQRYLYLHRIDARLFHRLSLGLGEALMVGNSAPELRYCTPLIVLHNFWPWRDYPGWGASDGYMTGSLFSFDVDWAIIPSLALYGQFVLNEFATPYERNNFPAESQRPNGLGYLAGIEYARSFNSWKALFYGEFVYADPYLYTLSSPFGSYIWMRRPSEIGSKDLRYSWIGHPEGRDMMLFALGAGFSKTDLALSADISFVSRGEHAILWDWAQDEKALGESTPSGTPERQLSAGLGATWQPFAHLSLSGYVGGVFVFDAGHQAGANESGLEMYFSAALSY